MSILPGHDMSTLCENDSLSENRFEFSRVVGQVLQRCGPISPG